MYVKLKKEEFEFLVDFLFIEYEYRLNTYKHEDKISKKCLIIHDKISNSLNINRNNKVGS